MKTKQRESKDPEKKYEVFYKLNINENTDITSTPHKEEYDEQNYESVEEWETALEICILCVIYKKVFNISVVIYIVNFKSNVTLLNLVYEIN